MIPIPLVTLALHDLCTKFIISTSFRSLVISTDALDATEIGTMDENTMVLFMWYYHGTWHGIKYHGRKYHGTFHVVPSMV